MKIDDGSFISNCLNSLASQPMAIRAGVELGNFNRAKEAIAKAETALRVVKEFVEQEALKAAQSGQETGHGGE